MFVSSVVAVAGGTGGVGRAIVEAILADGKQDVIILARQVCLSDRSLASDYLLILYASQAVIKKRRLVQRFCRSTTPM